MKDLLTITNQEMTISHRVVAEQTGNEEISIRKSIDKFISDFEVFGELSFEMTPIQNSKNRVNETKTYFLNEQQAYLLLTYLRNSEVVRNFKVALVKAFFERREELSPRNIYQGKNIQSVVGGYKSHITQQDKRIQELENRVQFLASKDKELKMQNTEHYEAKAESEAVLNRIKHALGYDELEQKYKDMLAQHAIFECYSQQFIEQIQQLELQTAQLARARQYLQDLCTNGVVRDGNEVHIRSLNQESLRVKELK